MSLPALFQNKTPPFPVAQQMKVLLMENSEASTSSSSPKRTARYYLIKELVLDIVAKLTPSNGKLYDRIRTIESALCKLRKKYMTKNMMEVCHGQ
jgi:hypothetical protein